MLPLEDFPDYAHMTREQAKEILLSHGPYLTNTERNRIVKIYMRGTKFISNKKPMKIHKTKDGEKMLIAEMEDQHLLNTITIMCKAIKTLTVIKPGNLIDRALHSRQEMSEEDRLEKIREVDEKLGDYVLEATIRGMNVTELLQKTYGRQNAVTKVEPLLLGDGDDSIEVQVEDFPF